MHMSAVPKRNRNMVVMSEIWRNGSNASSCWSLAVD